MLSSTACRRFPFLAAVALIAAASGNALVEGASNSGVFGSRYFDHDHSSVVPTLIAGALLALEIAGLRALEMFRRSTGVQDWLVEVATRLSSEAPARDFPPVYGLQLATLFTMESIERLIAGGGPASAFAWLGGPLPFALLAHALVGAGCTYLLAWLTSGVLAAAFASLIGVALEYVLLAAARGSANTFVTRRDDSTCRRAQAPHVRQIGGRAPPLLPTPV